MIADSINTLRLTENPNIDGFGQILIVSPASIPDIADLTIFFKYITECWLHVLPARQECNATRYLLRMDVDGCNIACILLCYGVEHVLI
jgi:hypothetical protein